MTTAPNGSNSAGTVLVVCPSLRDQRELTVLAEASRLRLIFHDYASIELEEMVSPAAK